MAGADITYFGNSAFGIKTEKGFRILIDPCITGFQGRGISPVKLADVEKADLMLVSHGAGDHLGDALELARSMDCRVICGPDVHRYLSVKGIKNNRMHRGCWGMQFSEGDVSVRCVESHHVSIVQAEDFYLAGLPMGFMITLENGLCLYHSGDTSIFSDLKLFGELYKPKIGFIPIGGFNGGRAEMTLEEAALATKWLGIRVAIPMHFKAGSEEAPRFQALVAAEAPSVKVVTMKPGETWKYRE